MSHSQSRLLVLALWTLLVVVSLIWNAYLHRSSAYQIATERGRALFQVIELVRDWNRSLGGIYAPIDSDHHANPYLPQSMREMTGSDGRHYARIHPAHMTRQLAELGAKRGFRLHLTSLKPLRPENGPDEWERAALTTFEAGQPEQLSLLSSGGSRHFRYMAPLLVEPECLICHGHQGYKVGDVRGGLSMEIDAAPVFDDVYGNLIIMVVIHLLVWSLVTYLLMTRKVMVEPTPPAAYRSHHRPHPASEAEPITYHNTGAREGDSGFDTLTGVYNSRHFENSAPQMWQEAIDKRETFSLFIIEVDQFNAFLQQYGHLEADLALRQIASLIRKFTVGKPAIAARYSTSTFTIIATNFSSRSANNLAHSLVESVLKLGIRNRLGKHDKLLSITCAVATASRPAEAYEIHPFFDALHDCLAEAKHQGRYGVIEC